MKDKTTEEASKIVAQLIVKVLFSIGTFAAFAYSLWLLSRGSISLATWCLCLAIFFRVCNLTKVK